MTIYTAPYLSSWTQGKNIHRQRHSRSPYHYLLTETLQPGHWMRRRVSLHPPDQHRRHKYWVKTAKQDTQVCAQFYSQTLTCTHIRPAPCRRIYSLWTSVLFCLFVFILLFGIDKLDKVGREGSVFYKCFANKKTKNNCMYFFLSAFKFKFIANHPISI